MPKSAGYVAFSEAVSFPAVLPSCSEVCVTSSTSSTIWNANPTDWPNLRNFSTGTDGLPILVCAPFTLHGATIADLVQAITELDEPKGVAVAVDRAVVPRSEWATTPARAGSLVEVVSAAAGG